MTDAIPYLLGVLSGSVVGFSLALIGGGGSILAVPLMIYVVGVSNPHVAIGTSAFAVAANAATSLLHHVRANNVRWRCGLIFAAAGVFGALIGSTLGKAVDGNRLLFLFGLVMILVGTLMLVRRTDWGTPDAQCDRRNLPQVIGIAIAVGSFAGFFGIGGGFLIVPGLMISTRMTMVNAVGTSLVAVTAFGLTTAANYAFSGLVDWWLALSFIAGGVLGGHFGAVLARRWSGTGALRLIFAIVIFVVAAYILQRSFSAP